MENYNQNILNFIGSFKSIPEDVSNFKDNDCILVGNNTYLFANNKFEEITDDCKEYINLAGYSTSDEPDFPNMIELMEKLDWSINHRLFTVSDCELMCKYFISKKETDINLVMFWVDEIIFYSLLLIRKNDYNHKDWSYIRSVIDLINCISDKYYKNIYDKYITEEYIQYKLKEKNNNLVEKIMPIPNIFHKEMILNFEILHQYILNLYPDGKIPDKEYFDECCNYSGAKYAIDGGGD